jgi:hypothetical protein
MPDTSAPAHFLHQSHGMGRTTVFRSQNYWRWLLPLILILAIAGVILGVYFANHHSSSKNAAAATNTPTAIPSPTPTLLPTATAPARATKTPAPTATPRAAAAPHATATPGTAATAAPSPTPAPTSPPTAASTVKLGSFTYKSSDLGTIQQGADAGNASYTYYLNPFMVIRRQLPQNYGFTAGSVTIVSPPPPPQPTPTPYSNAQGLPEVKVTVQYQGKRYLVVLDQPETQGPGGIWIIYKIAAA